MTAAQIAYRRARDAQFAMHEVEVDLERVRTLVRRRRLMAVIAGHSEEIRRCDAEIEQQRREIAELALLAAQSLKAA